MRKDLLGELSIKYGELDDNLCLSQEFEKGFYAGVRLFQAIMLDNFDF